MKVLYTDESGFQKIFDDFKARISLYDEEIEGQVKEIINHVKKRGDQALIEYTEKFDNVLLEKEDLILSTDEIKQAYRMVSEDEISAMKQALKNITAFHNRQIRNTWFHAEPNGNILGQLITPLDSVGIYVPGGKAAYPSSVLMCAIPAKIAGVKEIYCVSPPQGNKTLNPYVIVAADMAGIHKVYKIGGVQAVAALAFGTETVKKVNKIVGPGNIYVTAAKKHVFGQVDIDMLAGPSEILIIADENAPVHFIAADLLSQAEHDERASSILLTPHKGLIDAVIKEIDLQLERLERKEICRKSLESYGLIIKVKDIDQAVNIANQIAPEHLELAVQDPFPLLSGIRNAGSIFLGYFTPEPVGDYIAGPNHVLPTGGTASFFSALGVDDFIKRSGISFYSAKGLKQMEKSATVLAKIEGLDAHAWSVRLRLHQDEQ